MKCARPASFRRLQIEAMERVYAERGFEEVTIGPRGLVLLMSAVARNFVIETEVGVSLAHEEVQDLIARVLDHFDPLGEDELALAELGPHSG
jgi:hypothetical protein